LPWNRDCEFIHKAVDMQFSRSFAVMIRASNPYKPQ
jgi:hypothetical protein